MQEALDIWRRIHRAFEWHRKSHDLDAQSALDRIAMKCLKSTARRSFGPANCVVHETLLSGADLDQLVIYHSRTEPHRIEGPIVILRVGGRNVVIDGNTRANAWRIGRYDGPFSALVVEPLALVE